MPIEFQYGKGKGKHHLKMEKLFGTQIENAVEHIHLIGRHIKTHSFCSVTLYQILIICTGHMGKAHPLAFNGTSLNWQPKLPSNK